MPKLSIRHASRSGLLRAIADRQDFDTHGAMRGESGLPLSGNGILPRDWRDVLNAQTRAAAVDFVVYSYATPIGWHLKDGRWIVPDVSYSVTTSRHQGRLRWALHGADVIDSVGLFVPGA